METPVVKKWYQTHAKHSCWRMKRQVRRNIILRERSQKNISSPEGHGLVKAEGEQLNCMCLYPLTIGKCTKYDS